jgi:hypothetical protein
MIETDAISFSADGVCVSQVLPRRAQIARATELAR